ncbi:unnamed protein product [Closterium sp. NIES-65]|nr:unnamed protein product [Closterium sp. NIES-65]
MRKLKYHEQRLLRKVNFLQWKTENNDRELEVMRRYHITERDDYSKYNQLCVRYNRLCGKITKLATLLKKLDPSDAFRIEMTDQLLNKLYNMGVIPTTKSLNLCDKLSVSSFCRRRLAVVMVRLKMAEHMREAVSFVQQASSGDGANQDRGTHKRSSFVRAAGGKDVFLWVYKGMPGCTGVCRLAVVMVQIRIAEHIREAVSFVQQVGRGWVWLSRSVQGHVRIGPEAERDPAFLGHVRIGPEAVRDPAFLVTRAMEDMLTWVDTSKIKHKLRRSDRLLAVRSAACIFLQIPLPSGISPAAPAVPPHSLHALHRVVRELCHVEGSGQARLIQSRPVQWGVDRCRPIPTPPSSAFAPFRRLIPDPRAPAGSKRSFSAATSPPIPPNSAPSVGGSIGGSTGGAGGRKGGRGLVGVITAAAIAGAAGGAYYCVHVAEQDSLAAAVREREREGEVERERIEQQREEMGRELEEWKEGEARRQQEEEEEMEAISALQAVLQQQLVAVAAADAGSTHLPLFSSTALLLPVSSSPSARPSLQAISTLQAVLQQQLVAVAAADAGSTHLPLFSSTALLLPVSSSPSARPSLQAISTLQAVLQQQLAAATAADAGSTPLPLFSSTPLLLPVSSSPSARPSLQAISTLQAVLLQQLAAATAAETEAKEAAEAHGEQTELLKVEISALKDVFFHRSQEDRLSWHAHRVALISALRGVFFEPAQEERLSWHVHRVALDPLVSSLLPRGDDPLVAAIAATLPKSALANGVLTRQQLQERLEGMRARVCQLAMLPPANGGEREDVGGESGGGKGGRGGGELVEPGLLSQAVAAVAVALKFPVPTTPGEAPSPEQALSEATTLLVEGRLEEAAGAMERGVKGTRAEGVVRQWGEEVRGRAAVEQAVRVMQAHAGCMAAELRSSGKFESRRGGEGRAAVEQAVRVMQAHAGCMAAELRSAVVSGAVGGSGDAVGGGGEGKGSSGTGSEGDAGACRVHGSRAS